jgi:hypothetical protein
MKGTFVKGILSRAVKVAGSLGVIGGALAFAAAPAGAAPTPTYAYGVSAFGIIHIAPVAHVNVGSTPQVSAGVVYPGFVTTGGILDRAKRFQAYSQVGPVKVYGPQQVDQLNASMVSSTCRLGFTGGAFGDATIQAGSIVAPSVPFFPPIPLIRNPAPNTVINLGSLKITLNKQRVTRAGVLTVTGIFIRIPGQNLSIAVSRCGIPDVGAPNSNG